MTDALEGHTCTVKVSGRHISNLRFANDIDGLTGRPSELLYLANSLNQNSLNYGMDKIAEKMKIITIEMTYNKEVNISGHKLETVNQFKYIGAIISDEGSKPEVLARIAQSNAAMSKLKPIMDDKSISVKSKIELLRALAISIFLYASEFWTLDAKLR